MSILTLAPSCVSTSSSERPTCSVTRPCTHNFCSSATHTSMSTSLPLRAERVGDAAVNSEESRRLCAASPVESACSRWAGCERLAVAVASIMGVELSRVKVFFRDVLRFGLVSAAIVLSPSTETMAFDGRSVRPGDASPFDRDGLFFDMDGRLAGLCDGGGCTGAGGGGAGTDAALYLVPHSQQNFASGSFFVPHSGAGQKLIGGEGSACK